MSTTSATTSSQAGTGPTTSQATGKPKETITAALFAKYVRYYAPSQKAESGDELAEMARRARAAARQETRAYNKADAKNEKTDDKAAQDPEKPTDPGQQRDIAAAKGAELMANQADRAAAAQEEESASAFRAALGQIDPGAQLLDTAARAAALAREGARFYDRRDLPGHGDTHTTLWAMSLGELRAQGELYGVQAAQHAADRRARLLSIGLR